MNGRPVFHTWISAWLDSAQPHLKRGCVCVCVCTWSLTKTQVGKRERSVGHVCVGGCNCFSTQLFDDLNGLDLSVWKCSPKGYFTCIFQKYLEDMKTYFGATPQSVNFLEASDQVRKEINSWVESQTEGKLPPRHPAGHFVQGYFVVDTVHSATEISADASFHLPPPTPGLKDPKHKSSVIAHTSQAHSQLLFGTFVCIGTN